MIDFHRVRQIGRILHHLHSAIVLHNFINDARRCGDDAQIELPLQAFDDDFHMQKPQKTASESVSQRCGRLRLKVEGRVVHLQFLQGVLDVLVLFPFCRIDAAVDHGLDLLIARQRFLRRRIIMGDGITYSGVCHLLDAGADVADFTGPEAFAFYRPRRVDADFCHFVFLFCIHETDHVAFSDFSVEHSCVNDNTFVVVVVGVEDERLQSGLLITARRRDLLHDLLKQFFHAGPLFRRDERRVRGIHADDFLDLRPHFIGTGAWKIDFVQYRHDLQVLIHGQIHIGQSLGFDSLGGVHDEHGALAGSQRPRHFISEVHVSRRIDEIEDVLIAVFAFEDHPRSLQLDGDAPLPLQFHIIQILVAHIPVAHRAGHFDHSVRQCGFAVVDVCYNAEISDVLPVVAHTYSIGCVWYAFLMHSKVSSLRSCSTLQASSLAVSGSTPILTKISVRRLCRS